MEMKEVAGLLVNRFLQTLLRGGLCRKVTNSPGCDIIFRKRIDKTLADFGGICELGWGWWPPWISAMMLAAVETLRDWLRRTAMQREASEI